MDYLFLPSGDYLNDFMDCAAISQMLQPGDKFYVLQFPSPPACLCVASDRRVSFNLPNKYFDGRRLYVYGGFWDVEALKASALDFGLNKLYPHDHTFLFRPNLFSPGARFYWIGLNHNIVSQHVLKNLKSLFSNCKGGRFLDFELNPTQFAVILVHDIDFVGYSDILYYTKKVNRFFFITNPKINRDVLDWLFCNKEAYADPGNEIKAALDLHALFNARVVVSKTPAPLERLGLFVQQASGFFYAFTNYSKYVV